jgi:hypothetical protein
MRPPVALPFQSIASPQEAADLCDRLEASMESLLAMIEAETALVRKGELMAAAELQPRKAELVANYVKDVQRVKDHSVTIGHMAGGRAERMKTRHAEFRALLQINMAVLATAREVAEDLMRSVARDAGERQRPQTYAPPGYRAPGPAPSVNGIAVDRKT